MGATYFFHIWSYLTLVFLYMTFLEIKYKLIFSGCQLREHMMTSCRLVLLLTLGGSSLSPLEIACNATMFVSSISDVKHAQ